MTEILENMDGWFAEYQAGWLGHFNQTGEANWKIYNRPRNEQAVSGPGVDLGQSRLILISSAGSYLKESQAPFDAANQLGDYTIRVYPSSTPFDAMAYSHDHYDHAAIESDPQVLIPLRHLEDLAHEGVIGEMAPSAISFHGYAPDATRLVKETIPEILAVAKKEAAHAALLVPA